MSYSTSEFKPGLKVLVDNDPCTIIENEFVKPGKGQAFNRIKVRNLKTGRVLEKTYKSGDSLEAADVIDLEMHGKLMDLLGMPRSRWAKINIHIGAAYGDKPSAIDRWCKNFNLLSLYQIQLKN